MIGILTFYWADDYGALLQGYALKNYLSRYQKTVMIPYVPEELRKRYRLLQYQEEEGFGCRTLKTVKLLMSRTFYGNLKTRCKMCLFRKKYLTAVPRRLSTSKDIRRWGKNIRTYVAGSDQIWNPEITEGFQEGYFCTFRRGNKKGKRYVAYAASLGKESLEERYSFLLSELLGNFDAISLREVQSLPYIKRLYDRELTAVLDPVFLLGKKEWETLLCAGKRRKEGYIAVYYTEYNQEMAEYLKRLETRTGLHALILKPFKEFFQWTKNQEYAAGCGPVEFLKHIYDARYVVTNSFHGTAMSIIFHKQFLVFSHSTGGIRIRELLRASRLESRLADGRGGDAQMDEKIDWGKVDMAIRKEVQRSRQFIRENILTR